MKSDPVICPLDTRVCKAVTSVDQVLPIAVSGCNFTNDTPGTATVVADLGPERETIASGADDDLTTVAWAPPGFGVWILSHTVGGETLTGMIELFPEGYSSVVKSAPVICPIDTRLAKTYHLSDPIPPIAVSATSFGDVAADAATVVGTMHDLVSTPVSGETAELTNVVWQATHDGIWTFTHTVGGETLTEYLTFFSDTFPVVPQKDFPSLAYLTPIDTRSGTREITSLDQLLPIAYSGVNWEGASGTATVTLTREGSAAATFVAETAETGSKVWTPTTGGTYTFEHTSTAEDAETRSATFHLSSDLFIPSGIADILAPDEGYVESRDDVWTLVLTNDLARTVLIPDNMGPVVFDLNGHTIAAPNGTAGVADGKGSTGFVIFHDVDDLGPTELALVDSSGTGVTIRGGDGVDGNPSGAGGAAIEVADDANAGVTLDVGAQVTIIGGNGGDGVGVDAGGAGVAGSAGGAGVDAGPGTLVGNDGSITGGNGGDGTDGTTGRGGKGGLGGNAVIGANADPEGTGTETRGSDGRDGRNYTSAPEGMGDILDEDEGYLENIDGTWTWVVTNNVVGPVLVPDNLGPIALDLNGHNITATNGVDGTESTAGGDGAPAILIFNADGAGEGATQLALTNSTDTTSTVRGGDGGDGNPAGNGGAGIEIADDADAGVTLDVDEDVQVIDGADGDTIGVRVTFTDGTRASFITLADAVAAYRAEGGAYIELLADIEEDLVLEAGDDIVFDGGEFTLDGGFTVPEGATLAVIGGTFTTNPESPKDFVPRGCSTTANGGEPPTWTVSCDWLVGVPTAGDMKAFLTDDGTLKVVGEGMMASWAAALEPPVLPPWEAYDAAITNVAVGPLVTSIGSEAFSNCVNLVGVTLPGTIEDVGRSAFAGVNADGTETVSNGFVEVTYAPAKAGVASPFTAKEMRVMAGRLTGGTYDYDPSDEVDARYLAYDNGDGTWTIGEAVATIAGETGTPGTGEDERKYRSFDEALGDVGAGETITLRKGTIYTTAETLNTAFAEEDFTIGGAALLDVWGTLTNGVYACPIRLSDKIGTSEITGGDFREAVYTADGAIAGGVFSVRPKARQIKSGYAIVETDDEPARYEVVAMPENGVPVPYAAEEGLVYTGANQVGVIGTAGVVFSGPTNATEAGVYTVTATPEDGKTWPDGTTDAKTIVWGIAPAIDLPEGARIKYAPEIGEEPDKGGWKIVLERDVTGPIEIPDSLGEDVGGRVVLDLGGHTIAAPKAVQPSETNGVAAIVITHDPTYAAPNPPLDLEIKGPGGLTGGDGADGVPAHPEGGAGGPAISVEEGALIASGCPSVRSDVTRTPGDAGDAYVPGGGEPEGLLMTIVDSRDEYLALAIPYANTNSPAGTAKPTLDTVMRKAELAAGDCAYVYDRAGQTIAKYVLDAEKMWRPAPVIEVTAGGWTTTIGSDVCTLEPGYGFWLQRGATSRPNKVCLWGYRWTGASPWTVSLAGSEGEARGKTLVANPYGDAWDLNDATRVDWSATAVEGDWIQVNGGASAIYRHDGAKWVPLTFYTKDAKIPAGYGFWYNRAVGAGAATLTF